MKIPFLPLHIVEAKVLESKDEKIKALRSLTSDYVSQFEVKQRLRNAASAARLALEQELGIAKTPTIVQLFRHLHREKD